MALAIVALLVGCSGNTVGSRGYINCVAMVTCGCHTGVHVHSDVMDRPTMSGVRAIVNCLAKQQIYQTAASVPALTFTPRVREDTQFTVLHCMYMLGHCAVVLKSSRACLYFFLNFLSRVSGL